VKTCPIPKPTDLCIIKRHYVFALHHAKEKHWHPTGGKNPV
jgi:hypothetical protein